MSVTLHDTITVLINFGENFYNLLSATDTVESHLAKRLNVTRFSLWRWKNSMSMPKYPQLQEIARFFGVTIDWLLNKHDLSEVVAICQTKQSS